jgi:hypothetical protein
MAVLVVRAWIETGAADGLRVRSTEGTTGGTGPPPTTVVTSADARAPSCVPGSIAWRRRVAASPTSPAGGDAGVTAG